MLTSILSPRICTKSHHKLSVVYTSSLSCSQIVICWESFNFRLPSQTSAASFTASIYCTTAHFPPHLPGPWLISCWGRDRLYGEILSIILSLRLITPSLRQCLWDAEFSFSAGFRLDRSSLWRSLPCSHSSAIRQTNKTTTENLLLTQIKN